MGDTVGEKKAKVNGCEASWLSRIEFALMPAAVHTAAETGGQRFFR